MTKEQLLIEKANSREQAESLRRSLATVKREHRAAFLKGKRIGRLLIECQSYITDEHNRIVRCLCDCGTIREMMLKNLLNSRSLSCGCFNKQWQSVSAGNGTFRHGLMKSGAYHSWAAMIDRCTNPNNKNYHRYGGRGITVCAGWREDFRNFFEDMGHRPDALTLERIDNDKGYFKDNCKWATRAEQNRNSSKVHKITYNGKTQTLKEWSRELRRDAGVLYDRLKRGCPTERLFIPGRWSYLCQPKTTA